MAIMRSVGQPFFFSPEFNCSYQILLNFSFTCKWMKPSTIILNQSVAWETIYFVLYLFLRASMLPIFKAVSPGFSGRNAGTQFFVKY